MSTRTQIAGVCLFVAGLAVIGWLVVEERDSPNESNRLGLIAEEASRGTEEDPNARLNYERRRLRDPETGRIPDDVRQKELTFAEKLPERRQKATSWQPRGPVNVGGRSRALAVDVRDASTILAGGVSGGMWRTTDGGTSWSRTFSADQRPSVTWVTQDSRSGSRNVWYATTGEFSGNSAGGGGDFYHGNGVYKSTDGGQSWSLLSSTSGSNPAYLENDFEISHRVETDPSNSSQSEVYVAALGSIQRSLDGGSAWTNVLDANTSTNDYAITWTDVTVTSSGRVYAGLNDDLDHADQTGIFTSPNGDVGNWTDITPTDWSSRSTVLVPFRTIMSIDPSDEDILWVLVRAYQGARGPNNHELWKYDRAADTWTDKTNWLPNRSDGLTGTFNSQGGYDLILDVHPNNGDVLFLGGRNLWRVDVSASSSDATTWIGGYNHDPNDSQFADYHWDKSVPHHPDQHSIAFDPGDGDVMFVGSDGGIHRTDNNRAGDPGDTGDGSVDWVDLNNGYFTTQFYTVCQFPTTSDATETNLIVGGMQDNGTWGSSSTSASHPWSELLGADGSFCALTNNATNSNHSRYVSWQSGDVFRGIYDSNHNLTGSQQVNPCSDCGQLFINPFALDPSDRDVMYYPAGANLWRNNEIENSPGTGWDDMTGAAVPTDHTITALGVSSANASNVLYYGTVYSGSSSAEAGKVFKLSNANTVAAGSSSPTEVTNTTQFPDGGYVSSIAVDPTDSDKVMVVFSNYNETSLFYTADGGSSWTAVEGDLGSDEGFSPSVRSATILPQPGLSQTKYFVGTSIGVYSTTNLDGANTSWTQEGPTEIGDVVVDMVDARAADGRVIVGTHANGTYSINEPLPVELTAFDASLDGQSVQLSWTTVSETNNAGFEVQHKVADGSFDKLGFVEGHGSTASTNTYEYTASDLKPGRHTFRLRQVDSDGGSTYSEKQQVTLSPEGDYALTKAAPNPFRTATTMRLTVAETQPVTVDVYNAAGQHVRTILNQKVAANRGVDLGLDGSRLGSGLYLVRVQGKTFEATRKAMLVR